MRAWWLSRRTLAALLCAPVLAIGCGSGKTSTSPSITFSQVPPGTSGGTELSGHISGRVANRRGDSRIVIYAHSGVWWVQPFRDHPFTAINEDGSWESRTHLGKEYAALVVGPEFQATAKLNELPPVGVDVFAVAITKGSAAKPPEPEVLHFGGYDWKVRTTPVNHGGQLRDYERSNAWVDDKGYLHLLIRQDKDKWICSEIELTRSLGYGTYRFVVQDSQHLPSAAVLAIQIKDEQHEQEDRAEMDIELSQWGKSQSSNADYVIQPYFIPENIVRFKAPSGPTTHVLRWDPGRAAFRSYRGEIETQRGKVMEHTFKSGVPLPATETVHLDFYESYVPKDTISFQPQPVEIVVEKFEYLP